MSLGRQPRSLVSFPLILLMAAAGISQSACGKKGPPLPPLKHGPDRITSTTAHQEGKVVVVTGMLPEHSQDGGPLAPLVEVRVFRLDRGGLVIPSGPSSRSYQRTATKQFNKDAKRIAVLSGESLSNARSGRRITFLDQDPVGGPIPQGGKDLTYALTVVDEDKRSSTISPFAAIRVLPPPPAPANLHAEFSEKRIVLSWEPVPSSDHGASPEYNVYRSLKKGEYLDPPRNPHPVPQPTFEELDFKFGESYWYTVRTVLTSGKAGRESDNSEALEVNAKDIYPPAAPTGFAVSAESGALKLYWFPNQESDLASYKVYRSESEAGEFKEIASVPPADSSYVDQTVKPGIKYFYYVTSVDNSTPPNESGRSDVRGDRLPPAGKPAPSTKPAKR